MAIYPIAQNKKLNQKDLADKLNITPASVSVTVHRMESEGLLIRFPDEKDGRQFNLLLTEKGQKEKTTLILFSIVCSIINIVDAVRKGTHICQENQIECSM